MSTLVVRLSPEWRNIATPSRQAEHNNTFCRFTCPSGAALADVFSAGSLLPTLRGREMPVARLWAVARRRPDLSLHRQDQAATTPCFPEVPNLLARRNAAVRRSVP